jgi:hypothetical protein
MAIVCGERSGDDAVPDRAAQTFAIEGYFL